MIRGTVNSQIEAIVGLRIRAQLGYDISVDLMIDTGFSGALALPSTTIASLGLRTTRRGRAVLADGSVRRFDIFPAEILWAGIWKRIQISAIGDCSIVGMALLADHDLRIAVTPNGIVEIIPLVL